MTSADYYREQAAALREKANASTDRDERYAYLLAAIEFDVKADEAEEGQAQQQGNQPPPAPPSHDHQPAQQQQQIQPKRKAEE